MRAGNPILAISNLRGTRLRGGRDPTLRPVNRKPGSAGELENVLRLDEKVQIRQNSFTLKIEGLIWLDEIVEKLGRKHRVEVYEVEELFGGNPKFRFVERGNREGEDVYSALGRTEAGRYLIVFFIWKVDDRAIPISARDMTPGERKRYARK